MKINLLNENDNRPVFSKPLYNVSLPENATVGTTVLQVHVSRSIPDADPTRGEQIVVSQGRDGESRAQSVGWGRSK